jgi:ABC-type transport system involved in multi-copper enzyme maturation permease subunit
LTGSLAILISVIKIGTRTTIFSFYVGIAVFLFAGLGIGMLTVTHVPESIPPGGTEGMTWLAPFHPFWALWVALNKVRPPDYAMVSGYAWPIDLMLAWPHKAYMILTLLVSIGFVAWSTFYVRSGARQGEPVWWRRFLKRTWKTVRGAKLTRNPRNVWKNPIAWREAMTRGSAASSGWAWYGYLALGVLAGAILLYAYWTGLFATLKDARYWLSGLVLVEFVTVMLMAANTAATAISRERESATLELMLTTPMTSGDILWGKFRGLVSFTLPLLAVPAVTVLVAGVVDLIRGASPPIVYVEAALLLPLLLLVYSGFACVLGLQMSLKSKRSVQAVLSTVGILIGVGFGLGLCAASMFWNLGEFAAFIGPFTFVTALFSVLNPTDVADLQSATGTAVTTVRMTSLLGTVISAGIYLAIVFGIYKAMVRNFDMILRKQMR